MTATTNPYTKPVLRTRAMEILEECVEVQRKKAEDYQNAASSVKQADYYLSGIKTIYDTMHGKMLRIKSIMETMENDPGFTPNHEALADSCKDLINYAAFMAAYLEGKIPGQVPGRDAFNRDRFEAQTGISPSVSVDCSGLSVSPEVVDPSTLYWTPQQPQPPRDMSAF